MSLGAKSCSKTAVTIAELYNPPPFSELYITNTHTYAYTQIYEWKENQRNYPDRNKLDN